MPTPTPTCNCPICHVSLTPVELLADLRSWRCPRCQGQWIRGEHYRAWQERQPADSQTSPTTLPPAAAIQDSPSAKIFLDCGRLLRRQRAAQNLGFTIDRCNTCGGIWLDANEWDALRAHDLEKKIHLIFSAAWQARLQREVYRQQALDRLRQKLGDVDFAEIHRIKAWLEEHPLHDQLQAFLMDRE